MNIILMCNGKGTAIIVYCNYCLVPHPRAQLFTNHHLQPSPLFSDLSQKAPGTSANHAIDICLIYTDIDVYVFDIMHIYA